MMMNANAISTKAATPTLSNADPGQQAVLQAYRDLKQVLLIKIDEKANKTPAEPDNAP